MTKAIPFLMVSVAMAFNNRVHLLVIVLCTNGCAAVQPVPDSDTVSANIQQRMGDRVANPCPEKVTPPRFTPEQPLTEDHAVILALWNNAAFQEALLGLKITHGDLIQAGLLPNPEVAYFFEMSSKPFKYAFDFPIEALWLRPIRQQAAAAENARVSEQVTQLGLDLIRDTRQAYADLVLARERVRVAEEAVRLRERIALLAEARLKAGDVSKQDTAIAGLDALQAKQDAIRIGVEVPVAEERLKNLLGLPELTDTIYVSARTTVVDQPLDTEKLAKEASVTRPDYLAVSLAAEVADERVRLSRLTWFRFLGIADATSGQKTGHEFGPAFRMTLPIFNWNQGAIERAEAERDQLHRRLTSVQNLIFMEVRQAIARFQQTDKELISLRKNLRTELDASIKRSEKALELGNTSYLTVLENTRQLIDSYNREAQLVADRHRSLAELERSLGRRLSTPALPTTP